MTVQALADIDQDATLQAVPSLARASAEHGRPICVDLDGTLVKSDLLIEGVLSVLSTKEGLANLPKLWATSRAAFKQRVAETAELKADLLPYNTELIAFLRQEKKAGRQIILVTAADRKTAEAVAEQLNIFDEVIASDGVRNLKGKAKAAELVQRFGRKGFDYIGNDRADLAVWREAHGIGIVNAASDVTRAARKLGNVVVEVADQPSLASAAIRAMRPHQWVKNLLVFVPLLASRSFDDIGGLLGALCMFASFCATASGIYLFNDLLDLAADRQHPKKRFRPFACGALPLVGGMGLGVALIAVGIALAMVVGAGHLLAMYAVASTGYSLIFKQYPLLDVFILAGLYTLRIVAGGVASQHPITLWLLAFSGFTFLSLALVKRTGELRRASQATSGREISRRGYLPEDRPILLMFGNASAFSSSVVLALFVSSASAFQQYQTPEILWGLVPLVLFWHCRLWLSTERGKMHDDPIVYAFRDWVSWLVAGSVVVLMILASSPPLFW